MATDVAVRELSLLKQYNSKLSDGFSAKIQSEVSRICRKLESEIEKSIGDERQLAQKTQSAVEDLRYTISKVTDLKERHNFGYEDRHAFDADIDLRRRTVRNLEEQMEQYRRRQQQLRMELEGTIRQLKAFAYTLSTHVDSASQTLKSQIASLETYKDTKL